MAQIECPYCGHKYDLNTDDSHGVEENMTYEESCPNCKKWFTFTTQISLDHSTSKADCLNGSKHLLEFENSDFTGENLVFRCKTCKNRFGIDNHPVLKNYFLHNIATSDFEFNDSLFKQFGLVISQAIWNYDWALKSYIYFFGTRGQYYKNFTELHIGHQLKHLWAATDAKETIMRAFATLFPNECADIYRC
jgi:DNA-directed RNA polymerase subunit RPC12/RpoP